MSLMAMRLRQQLASPTTCHAMLLALVIIDIIAATAVAAGTKKPPFSAPASSSASSTSPSGNAAISASTHWHHGMACSGLQLNHNSTWLKRYDNMVHAVSSSVHRVALQRASRVWRNGIRSVIVWERPPPRSIAMVAQRHREFHTYFPDFEQRPYSTIPHHRISDRRCAVAPALAHQSLVAAGQSYDWMLVGDDDTVFFLEGVRRLLEGYDPSKPYYLTDHVSKNSVPDSSKYVCRPCHEPASEGRPRAGCPCTPSTVCAAVLEADTGRKPSTAEVQACLTVQHGPVHFGGTGEGPASTTLGTQLGTGYLQAPVPGGHNSGPRCQVGHEKSQPWPLAE